jgi:RNA polymerase sigma-70 factor (ECF subfamily)
MTGPPTVELPLATPVSGAASDADSALVLAAQREPRAFAELYLRYVDPVYRYCDRRLGSREAAEDATSLIFAKALAALPHYRAETASFRSWLFAIAHNVVTDAHRAARPTQPIDVIVERADDSPGPEAVLVADEEQRTVRSLLVQIAPDQRRVLELRLAGLTTNEIAAALGRKPGAVRATQFRALTRLRELLGSGAREREVGDA